MKKAIILALLLVFSVQGCQALNIPGLQDHASILYFNNSYYLAYQSWEDGRIHKGEIYIEQFDKNWNSLKRVRLTNNSLYDDSPYLIVVDDLIYLAYVTEISNGNYDIFVKILKPNLTVVKKVKITHLRSIQDSPCLLYLNNHIYMAYQSWESGNGEIYLAKFDKNLNFIKRVRVMYTSSVEDRPSLIYKDGFYVAYFSNRFGNYDIFVTKLDNDLDVEFEKRLTFDSYHQSYPSMLYLNGFLVFYASTESGTLGIYMNKYDDDWNLIEKKVIADTIAHERRPKVCYDGENIWVAYIYNRLGDDDWDVKIKKVEMEQKEARIAFVSKSNIVDSDEDGYFESFDLLIDADTNGIMKVRILAKPPNKWSDYAIIHGSDYDPIVMHFDASEFQLSHESMVEIKLELWNSVKMDEVLLRLPIDKTTGNLPPKNAIIVLSKNPTVGSRIVVFAYAEDPDGDDLYYKFFVKRGCCLYEVKDWSKQNYWVWNVKRSDVNVNKVVVWVRDGKHSNIFSYDTKAYVYVNVVYENLPPKNLVLTASNMTAKVNERVILFAHAEDSDGDELYYKFLIYDNGWKTAQNWSTKDYYVFYPDVAGNYRFAVLVIDGKHADFNSYDLRKEIEIEVKEDICDDWLGCP